MVGVALTSCKDGKKKSNEQKSENATQTALANGVYSVDVQKSVLNWKGFGRKFHHKYGVYKSFGHSSR